MTVLGIIYQIGGEFIRIDMTAQMPKYLKAVKSVFEKEKDAVARFIIKKK